MNTEKPVLLSEAYSDTIGGGDSRPNAGPGGDPLRFMSGGLAWYYPSVPTDNPTQQFLTHLADSLSSPVFIRLVLSGPLTPDSPERIFGRLVDLKGKPTPLAPVLEHGIMAERLAEWATDGLRALFLEWAGYRTKLMKKGR